MLIPRPETELLVEDVVSYLKKSVLGITSARGKRVELPWNDEVEKVRRAEPEEREQRAAEASKGKANEASPSAGGDALLSENEEDSAALSEQDPSGVANEDEALHADEAGEDGSPHADAAGEVPAADGVTALDGTDVVGDAPAADGVSARTPQRDVARVLEVGCGTGCISLSIASELAGRVTCVATDIEPRAVRLSERNRERAGISADVVSFREGDLVAPVRPDEQGTFDVLVSNPPYVPTEALSTMPYEVTGFEPRLALDGGADGLGIFRRLLAAAPNMLCQGDLFACELHENCLGHAAELCRAAGMHDVRVVPDLTGRPRFVFARTAGGH